MFAVVSESGVAAGVRRLEAICGLETLKAFRRDREELDRAAPALTARPGELANRNHRRLPTRTSGWHASFSRRG
jgi:alanyl-tRNA synthetase